MNYSNENRSNWRINNSLNQLVQEYLLENANSNFIDMENMIETLQQKSFRFSRMKRKVFAKQVKSVYDAYCLKSGIFHEKRAPVRTEDARSKEDSDSTDSEIEIEEIQHRPIMNNQVNELYQSRPKPGNSEMGTSQSIFGSSFRGPGRISQVRPRFLVTENFSTKARRESENDTIPVSSDNSNASESLLDEDEELQIIDEVVNKKPTSLNSLLGNPILSGTQKPSSSTVSIDLVSTPLSSDNTSTFIGSKNENMEITPSEKLNFTSTDAGTNNNSKTKSNNIVEFLKSDKVSNEENVHSKKIKELSNDKSNQLKPDEKVALTTPKTSQSTEIGPSTTISKGNKRKYGSSVTGFSKSDDSAIPTRRLKPSKVVPQDSTVTFEDFGGNEQLLEDICKLFIHLKHPEIYCNLGVTPPRGFLLHGPPGCGKTLLAQAIAGELKLPIIKMAATELVSGISGESESNIREVFEQALAVTPCIIFLDEIDAITAKRENASKEMERRIVAQLLSCIDDLSSKPNGDQVLLIGATSHLEMIDSGLRRGGRFDREICLGIPNESAREKILRVITKGLKLEDGFDFKSLANITPGYVGADLQALVREAAVQTVNKALNSKQSISLIDGTGTSAVSVSAITSTQDSEIMDVEESTDTTAHTTQEVVRKNNLDLIRDISPLSEEELSKIFIEMKAFKEALKVVQPSAKREGFATVPDITWDDIGALKDIRDELQVSILGPVKFASAFKALGLNSPAGVLLCGPPGCGKTLLAKAVANEAGVNFISVKGPELLNMYVGESEKAVRQCFQRAKNSAPCVIFFDEIDSLCPKRSDNVENGSASRIVNQLLTEMDGMESRQGVFVMGATNRPDIIDPAVIRPGRLDKILFVNLPLAEERVDILKAITKNGTVPKFAEDVNLETIGRSEKCENFTGADLASLVRESAIAAFREFVLDGDASKEILAQSTTENDLKIHLRHFEKAFTKLKPSVTAKDREKYEKMQKLHSVITSEDN